MGHVLVREEPLHYHRILHSFVHHCLDLSKNPSLSMMPPKTTKNKIRDIPWGDDNDQLVWTLGIPECEKDINYKVLFGKKGTTEVCLIIITHVAFFVIAIKNQNMSGDSKVTVFKVQTNWTSYPARALCSRRNYSC